MTTAITKRVSSGITASNTQRVTSPTQAIYDAWGGSWYDTWGLSWLVHSPLSILGHTARIASQPTENITKRVSV